MFRRKEAKEGMTDKGNAPGSAPRTPASWTGEDTLKKRCRRSEIGIRTAYERAVYLREAEGFLPFVVVADKEDAEITFDIHDRRPVTELMGESLEDRLIALEGAGWLKNNEDLYEFSMDPENLYYDIHGTVYVLMRYLRQEPPAYSFVEKYRSLIGAVLQDRYSYRDYLEGGQGLLEKDPFLATIRGMTRTKDIQEALRNEYLRVHEEAQALYVLQPKGKVRKLRRTAAASTVIAVSLASFISFRAFRVEPYHISSMALANAYVASDYTGCIRAMEKMSIRRMDPTQRYMLATAYVRLESLDAEQKENVLATLSLKDSSLRAEYWIHLGRWETDEAIDIAMQLADGQLEIYAYLKERARLEADTAMSGEEKQAAVDAVESRIEDLREKYGLTADRQAADPPGNSGDNEPPSGTYGTEDPYSTGSRTDPVLPDDPLSAGTGTEGGAQGTHGTAAGTGTQKERG